MVHIVHNLDDEYQGRIYLDGVDVRSHLYWTELPDHFTVDGCWEAAIVNPSRCALLCSDQWTTVSKTYRKEVLSNSSLRPLLLSKPQPFAYPNGVDDGRILTALGRLGTHESEKKRLLNSFFGIEIEGTVLDEAILFGFVGRVCLQKGVHLILESVESVLHKTNFKAYFIVGGMIDGSSYSHHCARLMESLANRFPRNFWAKPYEFFKEGLRLNKGADFFLMPSLFEPGGIVQHEALLAGTPVIAFKTGGLSDTIEEYSTDTGEGNGFLFCCHQSWDLINAINRALEVFANYYSYTTLRREAANSFMSIKRVIKAWRGELYRLQGKLSLDNRLVDQNSDFSELRVQFQSTQSYALKVNDPHLNYLHVYYKTREDNWSKEHHLDFDVSNGQWTLESFRNPNNEIKLFADDQPLLLSDRTKVVEEHGFSNNLVQGTGLNWV